MQRVSFKGHYIELATGIGYRQGVPACAVDIYSHEYQPIDRHMERAITWAMGGLVGIDETITGGDVARVVFIERGAADRFIVNLQDYYTMQITISLNVQAHHLNPVWGSFPDSVDVPATIRAYAEIVRAVAAEHFPGAYITVQTRESDGQDWVLVRQGSYALSSPALKLEDRIRVVRAARSAWLAEKTAQTTATRKRIYEAVAPDGSVVTRTTKRTYTYAVLVLSNGSWGAVAFCGRLDLAQKQYAKYENYVPAHFDLIALVPVSER